MNIIEPSKRMASYQRTVKTLSYKPQVFIERKKPIIKTFTVFFRNDREELVF